jgi:hypothetical protein
VKGGAGQYFTPRALIATIVDVMAPKPGQTIYDPACGTGGFLLAAHDYLANLKNYALDREQEKQLKNGTLYGIELVDNVTRLRAMNLLLHGIAGANQGRAARQQMQLSVKWNGFVVRIPFLPRHLLFLTLHTHRASSILILSGFPNSFILLRTLQRMNISVA